MLPGTIVSNVAIAADEVRFEIELSTAESVLAMQRIVQGANIEIVRSLPTRELDWREVASWLNGPLALVATSLPGKRRIASGTLTLLGIHLVWDLHRLGCLPERAANTLLREWKGRPVVA